MIDNQGLIYMIIGAFLGGLLVPLGERFAVFILPKEQNNSFTIGSALSLFCVANGLWIVGYFILEMSYIVTGGDLPNGSVVFAVLTIYALALFTMCVSIKALSKADDRLTKWYGPIGCIALGMLFWVIGDSLVLYANRVTVWVRFACYAIAFLMFMISFIGTLRTRIGRR